MILIDTSVWIDHLRQRDDHLVITLLAGHVLIHPWVIGEIACGSLKDREQVLDLLRSLPLCSVALEDEVLLFIEQNKLMARGIGYVDVHLLASTNLSGATLWTRDKRLLIIAKEMNIAYPEILH